MTYAAKPTRSLTSIAVRIEKLPLAFIGEGERATLDPRMAGDRRAAGALGRGEEGALAGQRLRGRAPLVCREGMRGLITP